MKQAISIFIFTIFLASCNQQQNIVGTWTVKTWGGQAYCDFNLTDSTTKTPFDEFAYTFFAEPNTKLVFTKDLTFTLGEDSSKHFHGTYSYLPDSILIFSIENKNLSFCILNETKDSLLLFTPDSEQIFAKNIRLVLKK